MVWWKDLQDYANSEGLEHGVYDSGVNGDGRDRDRLDTWKMNMTGNSTGTLGSMCRASPWGDEYLRNLTKMCDFAGLSQLNNDGDRNEQPCFTTNHNHVPSDSVIKMHTAEIKLWQYISNRTVWPGDRRAWTQGATSKFWVGGQQGADGGFDTHGFCTDNSGVPPCNSTMQWVWRERAALYWASYSGISGFSYIPVSVTLCLASETKDCYVGFFPGTPENLRKGAPGGISIEPFEKDKAARLVQYDWALSGPMGMGATTYIRGHRLYHTCSVESKAVHVLQRFVSFIKKHRRLMTADFIGLTPHDDPEAKTYLEHPSSWDAAMRVAPPGIYRNSTGLAMLMVWNQVEAPLSTTVDLGYTMQWADVRPGQNLSVTSAIAGPSLRPGRERAWAADHVHVQVGDDGAALLALELPAMSFQYYLIRAE